MRTNEVSLKAIAAPENLLRAWRSVRGNIPQYRREKSCGVDNVSMKDFENNLPVELEALRHSLLKGTYEAQPPKLFLIQKPNGGQRMIGILTIADRVAQRAAQQVIEPIWEEKFLPCSYGFRPGRSVQSAIKQLRKLQLSGYTWVVDGDIASCFESLDHDLLFSKISVHIHDRKIVRLLQQWTQNNALTAGPPSCSTRFSEWMIKTTNFLKQGAGLAAEAMSEELHPYRYNDGISQYSGLSAPDISVEDDGLNSFSTNQEEYLRQRAIRKIALGGLMVGLSCIRPALGSISASIVNTFQEEAGQRMLKKGAVAIGSAASLAIGSGLATSLMSKPSKSKMVGVLQGSPLSPLLANIYLHDFDMSMVFQGHQIIRYADDWVIPCNSQRQAEIALSNALLSLEKLKLHANIEKTHIFSPNTAFKWLGEKV